MHSSVTVGGAMMFVLPYFEDYNENGFREANVNEFLVYEPVNDVFEGWSELETSLAMMGEFVLGIDFGIILHSSEFSVWLHLLLYGNGYTNNGTI